MQSLKERAISNTVNLIKEIRDEIFTIQLGREIGFDFFVLFSQILLVQASSYFSLGVLIFFYSTILKEKVHIDMFFNYKCFNNNVTIFSWISNGIVNSFWLYLFIRRSKKCLDFTVTFHLVNFLFTVFYTFSIPLSFHWWIVIILNSFQMYVIGKNLCYLKESRSINLTNIKKTPIINRKKKSSRSLSLGSIDVPDININQNKPQQLDSP